MIVGTRPGLNVHIARQAHSAAVRVGQEHLTLSGHGLRLRHEIRHRYQLLDAVTTVTESDAHAYRRLGLPSTRVEAIPNSVPAASAEPADGTGKVVVAAGGSLRRSGTTCSSGPSPGSSPAIRTGSCASSAAATPPATRGRAWPPSSANSD